MASDHRSGRVPADGPPTCGGWRRGLDDVPLADVESWAGPDTWRSAGADHCRQQLAMDRQRIAHAADDCVSGRGCSSVRRMPSTRPRRRSSPSRPADRACLRVSSATTRCGSSSSASRVVTAIEALRAATSTDDAAADALAGRARRTRRTSRVRAWRCSTASSPATRSSRGSAARGASTCSRRRSLPPRPPRRTGWPRWRAPCSPMKGTTTDDLAALRASARARRA